MLLTTAPTPSGSPSPPIPDRCSQTPPPPRAHTLSCSIQYSTIQTVGAHLEYLQSTLQILQRKLQHRPGSDTNTPNTQQHTDRTHSATGARGSLQPGFNQVIPLHQRAPSCDVSLTSLTHTHAPFRGVCTALSEGLSLTAHNVPHAVRAVTARQDRPERGRPLWRRTPRQRLESGQVLEGEAQREGGRGGRGAGVGVQHRHGHALIAREGRGVDGQPCGPVQRRVQPNVACRSPGGDEPVT